MRESSICSRNFYVWGYRVYYRVHKNSPFDSSNKLLATPLRLGPPCGLFLQRVRNKIWYSFTIGRMSARWPVQSIAVDFITIVTSHVIKGTHNDTLLHVISYILRLCPFCYNIFLTSLCFQTEPHKARGKITHYPSCSTVVNTLWTGWPG
jgi:hypothetical protein